MPVGAGGPLLTDDPGVPERRREPQEDLVVDTHAEALDGPRHRRDEGRVEAHVARLQHPERHGHDDVLRAEDRSVRRGHPDPFVVLLDEGHDRVGPDVEARGECGDVLPVATGEDDLVPGDVLLVESVGVEVGDGCPAEVLGPVGHVLLDAACPAVDPAERLDDGRHDVGVGRAGGSGVDGRRQQRVHGVQVGGEGAGGRVGQPGTGGVVPGDRPSVELEAADRELDGLDVEGRGQGPERVAVDPVDPRGTEVDRHAERGVRPGAATDPLAGLEHDDAGAVQRECAGRGESGDPGPHDDDVHAHQRSDLRGGLGQHAPQDRPDLVELRLVRSSAAARAG